MVPVKKRGKPPAPHHVPHGNIHQNQQKAERPDEPSFELWRFVILQLLFCLLHRALRLRPRALFARTVARLLDGADDLLRACRSVHAHGIRQQTHRAARHARHLADRLFHPRGACRAAHARHIVLLHAFHLFDLSCLPVACPAFAYFISFCSVTTSSSITSSCPSRISFATHERR